MLLDWVSRICGIVDHALLVSFHMLGQCLMEQIGLFFIQGVRVYCYGVLIKKDLQGGQ